MVAFAYQTYALPYFGSVSQRSTAPLKWAQERLLAFAPFGDWSHVVFLLMIGAILPLSFACSRLLFVHGLGARLGPEAPPSRESP